MNSRNSNAAASRLAALRAGLERAGVAGFILPRADEHIGEYVPPAAERLAFLTGFTGSAGIAIVLPARAAVFSDGRYTLQLEAETDAALWERRHLLETPPEAWLAEAAASQNPASQNPPPSAPIRIGYDPWQVTADQHARFARPGIALVPLPENPVDAIWAGRPAPPGAKAYPHPREFAGEDAAAKRARIAALLAAGGQDALILSDPHAIAWLFNLRGADLEFTPVPLGFALLRADASATIFMAEDKLAPATRATLGADVSIEPRAALPAAMDALGGKCVLYDPATQPVWFRERLLAAGARVAAGADPIALPRARKNETEQEGSRNAHLRDGVAMVRFLRWLSTARGETELSAAARLLALRAEGARFAGESFPAISSAGPHGAVIHYRVSPETNRPIGTDQVYLIDSGGQYHDGTTDITRTVWTGPGIPPAAIAEQFTRVLAGHIALATVKFPEGVAGPHLDVLARRALWDIGLDYDHGTGHGVGSFLSVHEGPAGISRAARPVKLEPGMILSNEPGYYEAGSHGIRLENLLLVIPAHTNAERRFLAFETLTLAPFDRALIAPALLGADALAWLNAYHARVRSALAPLLAPADQSWLEAATAPLVPA